MTHPSLRIGFVPLLDAAPLIVAQANGYFRDERLDVRLERQLGWANIRDKLTFGHLDLGHALLGMPLTSQLGREAFAAPLVSLMSLGSGGNAITIRRDLYESGVHSAADLAKFLRQTGRSPLMVGHVFNVSMHHYLLRSWLDSANIDPDHDVKLCVIPPPQMAEHMRGGYVDLFCVGEPWNTLASHSGYGVAIVATTDIVPHHPEKVLAVTERFASANSHMLVAVIRAVLRACEWCEARENHDSLAGILARPEYVGQPAEILRESLGIGRRFGGGQLLESARPADWSMNSFAPAYTFPSKMHAAWMMLEMIRWGHLHAGAEIETIANRCCHAVAYREAAASLAIPCPAEEFVPMELRHGRWLTRENLGAAAAEKALKFKTRAAPAELSVKPRKRGLVERSL